MHKERRVTGKSSIFDTVSQILVVDAAKIIPLVDRCLVQDIPENDRRGSIFVPESYNNREPIRQGIVIAVGPGDKYTEHGFDQTSQVRREIVECENCSGHGDVDWDGAYHQCEVCGGTGCGRLPMYVKPGDRVLYSRRKEAEVSIGGVTYTLCNETQSIYAVLEEA